MRQIVMIVALVLLVCCGNLFAGTMYLSYVRTDMQKLKAELEKAEPDAAILKTLWVALADHYEQTLTIDDQEPDEPQVAEARKLLTDLQPRVTKAGLATCYQPGEPTLIFKAWGQWRNMRQILDDVVAKVDVSVERAVAQKKPDMAKSTVEWAEKELAKQLAASQAGNAPAHLVRIRGQAPLGATVYKLQKLRCNLCGTTFTAQPPPGVGSEKDKYDAEAASMIALLKYGTGLPFNRLERLEGSLGIPLPAATQWGIVAHSGHQLEPALAELIRQAAQGEIFHNDDTGAKILALRGRHRNPLDDDLPDLPDRKGVFTSGIVSILPAYRIALFFTGRRHAGENLAALLRQRASELGPPIQMCDALSRNVPDLPEELQTILAHCLTHGRRQFVDVAMNFPEECLYVLLILKDVYTNDARTQAQGMSPEQRLAFHQEHSRPKMEELKVWLAAQLEQKKVEPNSGLGKAILYMRKHWNELTLFLRQPGAPLDNNICERALKKAILHRKNAYFYKTENGAHVGTCS